ncbi:hypothetical protein [Amycolatopsis alkalitolerans]|uniref:Uncharacterized protein n=1 Tax=Amycolatopsis alkalitolerans TaxID=2547244 RepID=A0A5C4MBJ7_9PSEU|nr:hypothetical protein [Amycolatopsis alkalitolerans]TNC29660.1 hypothetical protein FG385_01500 [Amycolatopsis alkalitolerans]
MAAKRKSSAKAVARARSGGRSGWLWGGAAVAVVALLVVVIVVTTRSSGTKPGAAPPSTGINNPPATTAAGQDSAPPWPAPQDATAAVAAAGLPMLTEEGTVEHIHAHLDVLVDGKPVGVPADIGIDATRGSISPMHTHDATGVIHIESPVQRAFTLGEFFTEWNVSLSADNIGSLRATGGKTLRAYINGKPQTGNPAAIQLNAHDEIALVYGAPQAGESVPGSYDFPQGE